MPVSLWSECAIQANGSGQKQPSWGGLTSYFQSAELPSLLPATSRQPLLPLNSSAHGTSENSCSCLELIFLGFHRNGIFVVVER